MNAITTLIIALAAFAIAAASPHLLPETLRTAHPWLAQVIVKTVLVVEALLLMLATRCPLRDFGFRRREAAAPRSRRIIFAAAGLGAALSMIIIGSGLKGIAPLLKGVTFPQIVLTIWIFSSVTEEIFTRGWFQSTIADKVSLRAQLLLSAALFGGMHVSLFFTEVDPVSAALIVIFTSLLGYVCATLRTRTGSLLPAIWAHIAFNVGGMFGGIIATVARKLMDSK